MSVVVKLRTQEEEGEEKLDERALPTAIFSSLKYNQLSPIASYEADASGQQSKSK